MKTAEIISRECVWAQNVLDRQPNLTTFRAAEAHAREVKDALCLAVAKEIECTTDQFDKLTAKLALLEGYASTEKQEFPLRHVGELMAPISDDISFVELVALTEAIETVMRSGVVTGSTFNDLRRRLFEVSILTIIK